MLPGFRFLFAAIVLSISILVFGFGAAALLRTAHEEFANTPSWQPAPETRFAQQAPQPATPALSQPPSQPVLAMLRVDDPPKDVSLDVSNAASSVDQAALQPALQPPSQPVSNDTSTAGAADQAAASSEPPSQPDKVAALQPADSTPPETAKPEVKLSEAPVTDSSPPPAEAAAPPADVPAAPDATKLATTEPPPTPASEAAPAAPAETVAAAPEPPSAPRVAVDTAISTRIATLGGPPVTIAQPTAKPANAKSDTVKKHQHAKREIRRRRVARARLVKQTQLLDPFGQPATTAAATR